MIEYKDGDYEVQAFSCLSEVADYLEKTKDLKKYSLTKSSTLGEGFYGVRNFSGILPCLREGKQAQTEVFIKNLKDAGTTIDVNEGIFRDVEGFAYDMGSVVDGTPECCLNSGSPVVKKGINIYIDVGYSGSVEPETIDYRGFAIVKLLNTLIAEGYLLNVNIIHFITAKGRYLAQTFKINTDILDLSSIGFAGTCEFFRVVTWLLTAIQLEDKSYEGDGRSKPEQSILDSIKDRGDLYIPSGYTDSAFNDCSKEGAEKRVIEIFNKWLERNKERSQE